MTERARRTYKIDYVFARYPLWIRYSGLPQKIGPTSWCVFQRLLELKERFGGHIFHYALEKLCVTTGMRDKKGLKKVLQRLIDEHLIKYTTEQGRGKAAKFEIIEPLNTPLSEEDVYHIGPRLRSKSYQERLLQESEAKKRDSIPLFEGDNEKGDSVPLLDNEKGDPVPLLDNEKGDPVPPIKKIYIKRQQQQNDLFISGTSNDPESAPGCSEPFNDDAVVAFNPQILKEYGISSELAERYLRMYAPHYLEDKIEILEYKRLKGEQIRNPGGMLKKAIEEDWQRPEGFSTRAQREEAARAAKEAAEEEKRKEKERKEKIRREEETAAAAEEWKKTAPPELLAKIKERATQEVKARFPDTDESLLRVPIRLEENKIIAKEYIDFDST